MVVDERVMGLVVDYREMEVEMSQKKRPEEPEEPQEYIRQEGVKKS